MSGNRRRSLWIRVIGIALLCIFPVAALTFHLAEQRRADELARVRGTAQTAARMLARQIADLGQQTHIVMQGVAQRDPDTAGRGGADCGRNLREVLDLFPLFYQLAVTDAEGNLRCAGKPLKATFNVADRPYFKRAVAGSGFVLSQAIQGRDSGRWTLIAAQPLNRSDGIAGVVLGAIDLDWLQKLLQSAPLPTGAIVSVVDAAGTIIGRVPDEKKFVGSPVSDPELFRQQIGQSDEGLAVVRTFDDVERIVAYSRVPELPFYVRVGLPKADVDALAHQVLATGLLALFTVLAIGLGAAIAASHYFVARPMRQLGEAARRLGRGDMSARTGIDYSQPVVGSFARKLDQLAALGQRVTRALKTLSAGNRTLLRETEEQTLLDAMCRVAVDRGGYVLAMVNFRMEDDAKSVVTVASYGRSEGYIENMQLTWADSERGRGTVGTAIRTGERCILRSLTTDPRAAPWRDAAAAHGFGSIISLPLRVDGSVIGTLTLIACEEDAFDAGEVELLDEMAADLSFGIAVIRTRLKRAAAEQAAARLLIQDRVTDLPNRAAFMDTVKQRLEQDRMGTAVIIVHLPQLQEIFDCFGYNPGSAVIREIGQKLKNSTWARAGLARIAFNDIAIVLQQADADAARQAALDLLQAFKAPVPIAGAEVDIQAAAGSSHSSTDGDEPELLVRRASIAAREAARLDVSYFRYRGGLDRENPERLALAAELRAAIDRNELTLHYQPKLDIVSDTICGSEALVRWVHPTRGPVSPAQFIPIAEQTGLVRRLTRNVMDMAMTQQAAWIASGTRLPIAINLSARDLYDAKFLGRIAGLFERHHLTPDLIEFEITEGTLVTDPVTARNVLSELRALGTKIYIDDFGTGYSSLNYLVHLPVHALKIDRSFVKRMHTSREAKSVIASVISMAHNLDLRVVAEGVESQEDLDLLRHMGCDEAQGYFIGRPVAANEFAITRTHR